MGRSSILLCVEDIAEGVPISEVRQSEPLPEKWHFPGW